MLDVLLDHLDDVTDARGLTLMDKLAAAGVPPAALTGGNTQTFSSPGQDTRLPVLRQPRALPPITSVAAAPNFVPGVMQVPSMGPADPNLGVNVPSAPNLRAGTTTAIRPLQSEPGLVIGPSSERGVNQPAPFAPDSTTVPAGKFQNPEYPRALDVQANLAAKTMQDLEEARAREERFQKEHAWHPSTIETPAGPQKVGGTLKSKLYTIGDIASRIAAPNLNAMTFGLAKQRALAPYQREIQSDVEKMKVSGPMTAAQGAAERDLQTGQAERGALGVYVAPAGSKVTVYDENTGKSTETTVSKDTDLLRYLDKGGTLRQQILGEHFEKPTKFSDFESYWKDKKAEIESQPLIDPKTGQPVIDEQTGKPKFQTATSQQELDAYKEWKEKEKEDQGTWEPLYDDKGNVLYEHNTKTRETRPATGNEPPTTGVPKESTTAAGAHIKETQQAALDKKLQGYQGIIDEATNAQGFAQAAAQGNAEADPALILTFFKVMRSQAASGAGSGIRFTQQEQNLIINSRSVGQDIKAFWQKLGGKGQKLTPEQRQNVLAIVEKYGTRARLKREALINPNTPLTDDELVDYMTLAGGDKKVARGMIKDDNRTVPEK
jgi:hypothetical protein